MAARALIVINPNSSEAVTAGVAEAVAPLAVPDLPVRCVTLAEGPPGIESQAQADRVVPPLLDLAGGLAPEAAGFVIACFGDPGLHALRDETDLPVVGIQEAAVLSALTLGQRFGVISILPGSIPRHIRAFGAMGVLGRLAGDRAIDLGVAGLADAERTLARMIEVGGDLRRADGADVLIMGCAGMARYRARLQRALNVPIVEPCQAAVALAMGRVRLGRVHDAEEARDAE